MQASPINKAIMALQAGFTGESAKAVAAVVAGYKAAQALNKGQNDSLFAGFLTLASEGAEPAAIRAVGANIRSAVTAEMRETAGFTRVKLKGAKETGAPDFSTASVYAGIVAQCVELRTADAEGFDAAMDDVAAMKAEGETVHSASGLFATKNACARTVKAVLEAQAAKIAHQYPALNLTGDHAAQTVEQLEAANASLRKQVQSMLAAGDVGTSLTEARKERDEARGEVQALAEQLRTSAADSALLLEQIQQLRQAVAERDSVTVA